MNGDELTVFYSPAYCAARCDFDTLGKGKWIVDSLVQRPIAGVSLLEPPSLTADDLLLTPRSARNTNRRASSRATSVWRKSHTFLPYRIPATRRTGGEGSSRRGAP